MPSPTPRLTVCHGARATEEAVLSAVDELAAATRADPALLAEPVRLVVPSRSLRLHLSTRLVARHGRAVAGVSVQTHWAVALEVLERAGEPAPRGRLLFELLPRRLAVLEQSLLDPLDGLEDGYGAVVASVKDLLDANLEPAHEEGLIDALAELDRRGRGGWPASWAWGTRRCCSTGRRRCCASGRRSCSPAERCWCTGSPTPPAG